MDGLLWALGSCSSEGYERWGLADEDEVVEGPGSDMTMVVDGGQG